MMADTVPVRMARDYWLATGGKLPAGAQAEFPPDEANWLIEKGIAEHHEPVDPAIECAERLEIVRQRAIKTTEHTRYMYERDFARFATWCGEHAELPLPATVTAIVRYCVHRLHSDGVKFETVNRDIAGIAAVAALADGATHGGGTLTRDVRYQLNAVLRDATVALRAEREAAGKGSCYQTTPEQAAGHAFRIVEAKAAERVGIKATPNAKMNGKANGHAKPR